MLDFDPDAIDDDIDDIELGLPRGRKIDTLRERVDQWPRGHRARATYLVVLGEHLEMAGEFDRARACFEEVLEDGDLVTPTVRVSLLNLELQLGNAEAADALLIELLALSRAGQLEPGSHAMVGESLEEFQRTTQAHRWFTIPLRDIDPDDLEDLDIGCVHGRYRVRRELGLPLDAYDAASEAIKEFQAAERS
jgi:tetratricopeptide (TPR) repeat protein